MGKTLKQKIAEWWFRLKSISGVLADGENTYKKWQRTLTGFLIFFIVFEFVGPSAVAWLKVETAMAAVPAASFDVANNAVETFTSQNILNLPKFDDKNQALVNKALSGNQPDFDLVAILVDDDIANNASSYNGLIDEHNPRVPANHPELKLEGDTLMSRVERYAKDVQSSDGAAYVKTLIIKIKKMILPLI